MRWIATLLLLAACAASADVGGVYMGTFGSASGGRGGSISTATTGIVPDPPAAAALVWDGGNWDQQPWGN